MWFKKKPQIAGDVPETVAGEPPPAEGGTPSEDDRKAKRKATFRIVRNTAIVLVLVAAVAVLIAHFLTPVLHIYGHSMKETLDEGDIVLTVKGSNFSRGDVIAFYYNNKLLVKRVIGTAGDKINIDKNGVVYVNDQRIEEPYLKGRSLGDCNIKLPYTVPEARVFVMGDSRNDSIDSRNSAIGCVSEEMIIGKVWFKIWPLTRFGPVG